MKIRTYHLLTLLIVGLCSNCEKDKPTPSILPIPIAYFTIDKAAVKFGDTIHFNNDSQNASTYVWNFGDGTSSLETNPYHIYTNPGKYSITLIAKNGSDTSAFSREVIISNLTVMTYNIAFSGGAVDFLYDMWEKDGHGAWNNDRRAELLRIIRSLDPDILGLQEAWCWDAYDPPVYKDFADSLGMEYVHYLVYDTAEWNGICVYSKFPIESTDFILHQPCVPNQIVNGTCMVESVIKINDKITIDVLTCHLMFQVPGAQTCEVEAIHKSLSKDFNPYTILMGDMNYVSSSENGWYYNQLLGDAGLTHINSTPQSTGPREIDQIWASKKLVNESFVLDKSNINQSLDANISALLSKSSDHKPVIAYFYVD